MRVTRSMFVMVAVGMASIGLAQSARLQDPPPISRTYILTQAICLPRPTPSGVPAPAASTTPCQLQIVPLQATAQVQLPGTPSRWSVVESPGFARGDAKIIQSQGRIAGTSEIYLFNFTAAQKGPGKITLKETPPFIAKQSNGLFTYTIMTE